MVQTSQVNILEAQIRECYGRVVWTHKTHEKCADILAQKSNDFKLCQIILSAITTSGIFVTILGNIPAVGILSAITSISSLILNTYLKNYDLDALAQKHTSTAISIWNIRESYLSLLTDIKAGVFTYEEVKKIRDQLQSDLHKLYKGSPRTMSHAYNLASKALKEMEEMTFSDAEIDKFLPKELRKEN